MKKQLGLLGTGILVALLVPGLSTKGSYGKVPVNSKSLSRYLGEVFSTDRAGFKPQASCSINSLFVKHDGSGPIAMIVLVAHSDELTRPVQEITQTKQTPLILSVSTLPLGEVDFNPGAIEFEQDNKVWQPDLNSGKDVFPLNAGLRFGGVINDGQIQQGVVLLPEWFDVHRPLIIRYLNSQRLLRF